MLTLHSQRFVALLCTTDYDSMYRCKRSSYSFRFLLACETVVLHAKLRDFLCWAVLDAENIRQGCRCRTSDLLYPWYVQIIGNRSMCSSNNFPFFARLQTAVKITDFPRWTVFGLEYFHQGQ